VKRLRIERGAELIAIREEPPRIERELGKLLSAIKAGGPIQAIVDDVKRLEARKLELNEGLENAKEPHPPELMLRHDFAGLFASRSGEVSRPSCAFQKSTSTEPLAYVAKWAEPDI
jgi:site-specific DNA recombinase